MGKLPVSRRYDLRTLAAVRPWGVPRELAVQDLPGCKGKHFSVTGNGSGGFFLFYVRMADRVASLRGGHPAARLQAGACG